MKLQKKLCLNLEEENLLKIIKINLNIKLLKFIVIKNNKMFKN